MSGIKGIITKPISSIIKDKDDYEKIGKIVAIFLAVTSLLAVYVNTTGGSYSGKASSQLAEANRHMLNATDWWNYYQAHRLRSTMYYASFMQAVGEDESSFSNISTQKIFSGLDSYYDDSITAKVLSNSSKKEIEFFRNDFINNLTAISSTKFETKKSLLQEYLKGAEKSIAKAQSGQQNALSEEKKFMELMDESSKNSAYGSKFSLITTLFVVAVTLGGIANITKRKLLAYVCIFIGIIGILNLTTIMFAPQLMGLPIL